MNRQMTGVILFVVLGSGVILGTAFWWKPWRAEKARQQAENERLGLGAGKVEATIRIGADNYLGYFPATQSPDTEKALLQRGVGRQFVPDDGGYADRLNRFAKGELDMMLLPVSQYLKYGKKHGYPGLIVAGCSDSRGADAIVVRAEKFPKGVVSELDDPSIKIACTPDSPSSDLMDLARDSFEWVNLTKANLIEAKGSSDAMAKLERGDVDAAVLWEPDISVLMKKHPGKFKVILDSGNFSGAIKDVFVVRADFLSQQRSAVDRYFAAYFQVMNEYTLDRSKLVQAIKNTPGLGLSQADDIETTIRKIQWFSLAANCRQQFGILSGQQRVLDCVLYWRTLHRKSGALSDRDLQNPLLIINKAVLEGLKENPLVGGAGTVLDEFPPLSDPAWAALVEVGNINLDPIDFYVGRSELTDSGKEAVDKAAFALKNQLAEYRIAIRGHTGTGDDEDANKKLSLERAKAVADYLVKQHQMNRNRLHAEGLGSSAGPPKRKPEESYRAWQERRSRVEFVLLRNSD